MLCSSIYLTQTRSFELHYFSSLQGDFSFLPLLFIALPDLRSSVLLQFFFVQKLARPFLFPFCLYLSIYFGNPEFVSRLYVCYQIQILNRVKQWEIELHYPTIQISTADLVSIFDVFLGGFWLRAATRHLKVDQSYRPLEFGMPPANLLPSHSVGRTVHDTD
ncbi:hypothetical protein ASPVEDRAFT_784499 [Aspergillus versicolor CBS 583.65]|uniref:Uncharacterized protein n=1 Tax=Aspergillus versicolor CBS 583.65 TaxID=1036611 RepID=A0A1L9PSG8_ASPVE|nr:uncharacterized protein ASPVEDRAFT_784499 [Aspergillus versicolor CBS 583.65]OJJ04375.1 hypothetical protein ASPVEDRAFT_784499 [Aspergillus versicolor CBS 583.65]